jgi:5-methylcytosine-specific restriction endonuclease McrA
MARLEIEHLVPIAEGGSDDETNLWLACPICNAHKSDKTRASDPETGETVPLFNPVVSPGLNTSAGQRMGYELLG